MVRGMLGVAFAVLAAVSSAGADSYKLTGDNTEIKFTGTKKDGKHDGGFKKLTGTASVEGDKIAIDVEIETDSIYTDNGQLTGHLKGSDFFGVKDNPKATFKTTKVEKTDSGYKVTGDFTLLGKKKEISFPATIGTGDTFTLKAEFKIDRTDYGMTYGKGMVNDDVAIKVDLKAKK
jgi:polyisoprenoid-binding protein YceI